MIVNIYGSTGIIGRKALLIIKKKFSNYKINLLCAKNNVKLLAKQSREYNVKYVYLDNQKLSHKLKSLVPKDVKILEKEALTSYLKSTKSDLSILSVAGFESLKYLELILINSHKLGIVSKEAIVSAGHIVNKIAKKHKTQIIPLDSEHFSIYQNFNKLNLQNSNLKKIYLTASGGPFLNRKFDTLKKVSFKEATNHPKWKMGYKNSIDSATLVNKCLELIEAHYLFNIPIKKLDILIHPQSLVHSIIEGNNYVSNMIYFYNDMKIPLLNFLDNGSAHKLPNIKKFNLNKELNLNFLEVSKDTYPLYFYFKSIDKTNPCNLIKFNIGNEYAVDLFKQKKINYPEIMQIIKEITSLKFNSDVNTIDNIIQYHENLQEYIQSNY